MRITFDWKKRARPEGFSRDDFEGFSGLELAVFEFTARYSGQFNLEFPRASLTFDLRPDLSTIFMDMPECLRNLADALRHRCAVDSLRPRISTYGAEVLTLAS